MAWTTADIPSQSGRIAVVTGANSGIGLETARALAERGAHVVLACRNQTKGAAALAELKAIPDASVELMALDLADLSSVRTFAEAFDAAHERLDILVNNAGVMMTPLSKTADGFEMQFGTNHLGHFALTGLLLDKLLAAEAPRIVNVSSNAHKPGKIDFANLSGDNGYSKLGAYCQSKLANLLFSLELQRRLKEAGHDVIVASSHPGWTASNLMDGFFGFVTKLMAQNTASGALPSLYAATAPDVEALDYFGPAWFEMVGPPKRAKARKHARDDATARRLWEVSSDLTGVSYL
jgi:NAD(P)-dependent dehydrogenase (short-subunit alcohol dehydrogenase family)